MGFAVVSACQCWIVVAIACLLLGLLLLLPRSTGIVYAVARKRRKQALLAYIPVNALVDIIMAYEHPADRGVSLVSSRHRANDVIFVMNDGTALMRRDKELLVEPFSGPIRVLSGPLLAVGDEFHQWYSHPSGPLLTAPRRHDLLDRLFVE
jgi:hypothetical protein